MDIAKHITIDPARRSGKPCIRDTRITVYDVLDYLASGMSQTDILADFPELNEADIHACLTLAADRKRRVVRLEDFTDNDMALIGASNMSPEYDYLNAELDDWHP